MALSFENGVTAKEAVLNLNVATPSSKPGVVQRHLSPFSVRINSNYTAPAIVNAFGLEVADPDDDEQVEIAALTHFGMIVLEIFKNDNLPYFIEYGHPTGELDGDGKPTHLYYPDDESGEGTAMIENIVINETTPEIGELKHRVHTHTVLWIEHTTYIRLNTYAMELYLKEQGYSGSHVHARIDYKAGAAYMYSKKGKIAGGNA